MRGGSYLAISIVCATAAPLAAQYREGTPEVIAPPPARFDSTTSDLARARAAYNAAGSPRVVVFWNRELSDRVANDYDEVLIESGTMQTGIATGVSRNRRYAAGSKASNFETVSRQGRREVEDDRRDGVLSEKEEWQFLQAFENRLRAIGLVMVSREVAMRKLAAEAGGSSDKQSMEMQGIADFSDVMLTVLQTPDPAAPVGVLFRVTATRLSDGVVIASVTGGGERKQTGPGRFVAGADGFERARPSAVGIEDVGENLAMSVLVAMSSAWS